MEEAIAERKQAEVPAAERAERLEREKRKKGGRESGGIANLLQQSAAEGEDEPEDENAGGGGGGGAKPAEAQARLWVLLFFLRYL